MTTAPVLISIDGSIATITLNRPERMNSLAADSKELILDALQAVATDAGVRCVVLTGTGRAFCAGQDIGEMIQLKDPGEIGRQIEGFYAPVVKAIIEMPKPVVAALNGVAVGAGLAIALACDVRVAAASVRLGTAFAGIGLSCDTGMSWTLPRIVGRAAALDLLLRPRMIGGDEALGLGLVSEVYADAEFAGSVANLAALIAAGPTRSFASMKASVHFAETSTLDEALAFEADRMVATASTSDHRIAVAAFLAKETPAFIGS